MVEYEVYVDDVLTVVCPNCGGSGEDTSNVNHALVYANPDRWKRCGWCDGDGEFESRAHGETVVNIEPPERDIP